MVYPPIYWAIRTNTECSQTNGHAYNSCEEIFVVCQTTQLATMRSYDLRLFSTIHQMGNSWEQNCGLQYKRWYHFTLFTSILHKFTSISFIWFVISQQGFFFFFYRILPNCHPNPLTFILCLKDVSLAQLYLWIRQQHRTLFYHFLPPFKSIYTTLRAIVCSQLFF